MKRIKEERDGLVRDVISGEMRIKLLIIVGPCSAHESAPVLEYVKRLGKLSEKVKDRLVLVPRIYTNKPRTRGVGYKGMFLQPDPENKEDIVKGDPNDPRASFARHCGVGAHRCGRNALSRKLLLFRGRFILRCRGGTFERNQMHRLVSSGAEVPVGIKNPMSGSIPVLLNSIYASQQPQVFKYGEWQVATGGNEYAHAVLRGMVDSYGNDISNYHYETVMQLFEGYQQSHMLKNPAVIIDSNHSNSGKRFREQIRIVKEVMQNRTLDATFKNFVKGFMIESFLVEGCQKHNVVFGQSITDACLGWEDTERLILDIAEKA